MEGQRYEHPYYGRPDAAGHQEPLFSAAFKKRQGYVIGFTIIGIQIGLPLIAAALARSTLAPDAIIFYIAGFLIATGAYVISSNLLPVRGYSTLREQCAARILAGRINLNRLEGIWVGFSPDAEPRIYTNNYDWDVGFLVIMPDRLCYLGEQARFALQKDQVVRVKLGSGGPSWFGLRRVYVDWRDDNGNILHLNFRPADAPSMRRIGPMASQLRDRLLRWQVSPSDESAVPSQLAALGPPSIGQIPSQSLDQVVGYGRLIFACFNSLVTSAIICFIAGLPFRPGGGGQALYVLAVGLWLWVLQAMPILVHKRSER